MAQPSPLRFRGLHFCESEAIHRGSGGGQGRVVRGDGGAVAAPSGGLPPIGGARRQVDDGAAGGTGGVARGRSQDSATEEEGQGRRRQGGRSQRPSGTREDKIERGGHAHVRV
jgi:hypothetical protein